MRPFRFLATVDGYPRFAELTSLARKAEAVGCSTFVLPGHLIGQYAAIPLLAVVAAASERLRVGTFVLNACLRHPAVLAQYLSSFLIDDLDALAPVVEDRPDDESARRPVPGVRAHALSRGAWASIVVVVSSSRKPPDWCCHSRA